MVSVRVPKDREHGGGGCGDGASADVWRDDITNVLSGAGALGLGQGTRLTRAGGGPDVETEHHSAFDVLGDVAVGHPAPRIRDLEQDVDGLPSRDKDGVLPDQVLVGGTVAGKDQESTGTMDVERMVHRMVRSEFVDETDLDAIADGEGPEDVVVLGTGPDVGQTPDHVGRVRLAVDL